MDRKELSKENILKALQIYYRVAYGKEPRENEARRWPNSVMSQIELRGYSELRIGLPSNGHAKFWVESGYRAKEQGEKYILFVDTNDSPGLGGLQKKNSEFKGKIEKAWKEAGFPVKE
tara:strand:+ start:264 stop:617 length:354 start_codon:yes stop_codon:yes gene_type:complete